jgi:hypothetical protein
MHAFISLPFSTVATTDAACIAIPDLHTSTNYCAIEASVIAAFDAINWRAIAAGTTTALYADYAAIFVLTPDNSPVYACAYRPQRTCSLHHPCCTTFLSLFSLLSF